jgi:putative effector of murein hydrolase LrgA (UPF0299 family)
LSNIALGYPMINCVDPSCPVATTCQHANIVSLSHHHSEEAKRSDPFVEYNTILFPPAAVAVVAATNRPTDVVAHLLVAYISTILIQ